MMVKGALELARLLPKGRKKGEGRIVEGGKWKEESGKWKEERGRKEEREKWKEEREKRKKVKQ